MKRAASSRRGDLRSLGRNFLLLLGGRGAAAIFSLAYLAILTRTLGTSTFGQFALIVGTAQAITAFVSFQSWQIVVRFGMDEEHGADDTGKVMRLVKFCLVLDVVAALAGALLALVIVIILKPVFGWDGRLAVSALLLTAATLFSLRSTAAGILRFRDRFDFAAHADAALTGARLVGSLLIWASGATLIRFLIVWGAAEFVAMAVYWTLAIRSWPRAGWRVHPMNWRRTLSEIPGLARFALATNVAQTVVLAGKQLPVLLTGAFVGPAAAGGFHVALQVGRALAKIGQLAVQALLPEMMRFGGDGTASGFTALVMRTIRIAAIAGSIVVAAVVLFGQPALELIAGSDFVFAYPLLVIVAVAAAVDLAIVPLEPALYTQGRELAALKVRISVTLIYVLAMVGLGSLFGAIGIALATLLASLLTAFTMGLATRVALRAKAG